MDVRFYHNPHSLRPVTTLKKQDNVRKFMKVQNGCLFWFEGYELVEFYQEDENPEIVFVDGKVYCKHSHPKYEDEDIESFMRKQQSASYIAIRKLYAKIEIESEYFKNLAEAKQENDVRAFGVLNYLYQKETNLLPLFEATLRSLENDVPGRIAQVDYSDLIWREFTVTWQESGIAKSVEKERGDYSPFKNRIKIEILQHSNRDKATNFEIKLLPGETFRVLHLNSPTISKVSSMSELIALTAEMDTQVETLKIYRDKPELLLKSSNSTEEEREALTHGLAYLEKMSAIIHRQLQTTLTERQRQDSDRKPLMRFLQPTPASMPPPTHQQNRSPFIGPSLQGALASTAASQSRSTRINQNQPTLPETVTIVIQEGKMLTINNPARIADSPGFLNALYFLKMTQYYSTAPPLRQRQLEFCEKMESQIRHSETIYLSVEDISFLQGPYSVPFNVGFFEAIHKYQEPLFQSPGITPQNLPSLVAQTPADSRNVQIPASSPRNNSHLQRQHQHVPFQNLITKFCEGYTTRHDPLNFLNDFVMLSDVNLPNRMLETIAARWRKQWEESHSLTIGYTDEERALLWGSSSDFRKAFIGLFPRLENTPQIAIQPTVGQPSTVLPVQPALTYAASFRPRASSSTSGPDHPSIGRTRKRVKQEEDKAFNAEAKKGSRRKKKTAATLIKEEKKGS